MPNAYIMERSKIRLLYFSPFHKNIFFNQLFLIEKVWQLKSGFLFLNKPYFYESCPGFLELSMYECIIARRQSPACISQKRKK